MKKLIIVISIFLLMTACSESKDVKQDEVAKDKINSIEEKIQKNNFVSYNKDLKVDGVSLVNSYNEKFQLKGISSHGIQWYNNFINDENIKTLKQSFNINVFRLAIYTKEGGYIDNKDIIDEVYEDIDLLIDNDLYVIVDWHILSDGNPNTYLNEALTFFEEISSRYKDKPNIIYEICNEPNKTSWAEIKSYAEKVIEVIRRNCNNVIVVGTNTWSQDVLDPVTDKIDEENIMYALHFYAGTHTDYLRNRAKEALNKGVALFVSEWGVSDASGNGGVFFNEARKWIDFINENNLSYINWSLSDKNESSALLRPGTNDVFSEDDLSEAGKFVKEVLTEKNE